MLCKAYIYRFFRIAEIKKLQGIIFMLKIPNLKNQLRLSQKNESVQKQICMHLPKFNQSFLESALVIFNLFNFHNPVELTVRQLSVHFKDHNKATHFYTRDEQNEFLKLSTTTPTRSIFEEQPPTTTPILPQYGVKLLYFDHNFGKLLPTTQPQPN